MKRSDAVVFVTGIDTEVGKTYVTGLLAAHLLRRGRSVITQKLVQTGCTGLSADIRVHRRLMGVDLFPEDLQGTTCPYVFEFPASPHLAARCAGRDIDPERLRAATDALGAAYESVILEGIGGLCVPLTERVTVVEYVARHAYPTVLVSTGRLGSINHTLMSMELLHRHAIPLRGIAYNRAFDADPVIASDSRALFRRQLDALGYPPIVVDIPRVPAGSVAGPVDVGALLAG